MATVTGYTAEHMQEIEDGTIVDADIVGGHLILIKHDGSTVDAGNVVGPAVGGTIGQVYAKLSSVDYHAAWTSDLIMKTLDLGNPNITDVGFRMGVDGEPYERIQFRGDRISIASGLRAPFGGSHTVGTVGIGSDSQVYIEGLAKVANLLHIQGTRPGSIASDIPPIVGSPVFPMTSGSVTVTDASEIPSTDGGPNTLGKGYLVAPGFSDNFNRADSTSTLGAPWVAQGGSVWGISSNKAYCVSGGSVSRVTYNTGGTRHRVTFTASGTNADWDGAGIIFSYVDANNMLYLQYNASLGGTWNVYKLVAGTSTFLFNSGTLQAAAQTISAEYKDGIVSVTFEGQPPRTSIQSLTAGTSVGLRTPTGGPTGATVRWDDFSVVTEYVATWTGKTGNTLTGFTCTTATGTADSTWAVKYRDGTRKILTRWSDSFGAPIAMMYDYGGLLVTDDINMSATLSPQVGMSFTNLNARTNPGLILFGDDPISGSGDDAGRGMVLRRVAAGRGLFGGRLFLRPPDITNSAGVGSTGTAADPHLSLGEVGNGFFFKAPGLGLALAGSEILTMLSTGLIPTTSGAIALGTSSARFAGAALQGALEFHDGFGAAVSHSIRTSSPVGISSANPGSTRYVSDGTFWLKKTGTGNTGWSRILDDQTDMQYLSYRVIPVALNLAQALTTTLTGFGAFDRVYLHANLFTIPTGFHVEARCVSHVKGHTSGDVIGTALYDNPTAGFVIAETAYTTNTSGAENVERVTSNWVNVPTGATAPWQATIQLRNQTGARGTILGSWIEVRFSP